MKTRPASLSGRLVAVAAIAFAAGVDGSMQAPASRIVRQIDWTGRGVWLKADLHTHTRFSDGRFSIDEVVRGGEKYGCDVVAITDHADAELRAATPEYLDAIRAARLENPALIVVAGLEWNVPPGKGDEHAGVLFPSAMETVETFSTFKSRFDDWKREDEDPDLAGQALKSLVPSGPGAVAPVVMLNHPSRKPESASAPRLVFDRLRQGSPLLVGIEGAPGHQRAVPLGAYESHVKPIDRWDPLVAEIGGAWDQWLQHGLDVWAAAAGSDFHDDGGDFWPCQFAATWVYSPDRTADGVLRALRAGSFFGEHGHIVTRAELDARVPGLARPVAPGETVQTQPGLVATVRLRTVVPERDYLGNETAIDRVELIGITGEGSSVLYAGSAGPTDAFNVSVTVPPNGIVLRARGSRATSDGNLFFYTNPIRIVTAKP